MCCIMVVFTTMTKGHKINLDQKLIEQKRKKISEGITEGNRNEFCFETIVSIINMPTHTHTIGHNVNIHLGVDHSVVWKPLS